MTARELLRLPPHSIESEQSLLGGLLLDNAAWARIAGQVSDSDFYRDDHRRIFRHIARLIEAGRPADVVTVFESLEKAAEAEQAGGMAYLIEIANNTPSAANIRRYAEIVRERAIGRQLQAVAKEIDLAAAGGRDLGDVLADAEQRLADVRATMGTREIVPPFVSIEIEAPPEETPQPAADLWDGLVPASAVTVLGAHGGTGKSFIGLMLAAAAAAGRELFGIGTTAAHAAFFSAEDAEPVIRRRLSLIAHKWELPLQSLAARLHVLDATKGDPTLFRATRNGTETTPAYSALASFIVEHDIRLLVVDNASDVFGASEIERAAVRGFMRALADLVRPTSGAVLLLVHVDKSTARFGGSESYSGSTAWHNSARSRLTLAVAPDGGLRLEHAKNNHGRRRDPIDLIWPEGDLPQVEEQPHGIVGAIKNKTDAKALLRLIHEATSRREFISPSPQSRNHAVKVLAAEPGFPRCKPAEVFRLLRNAEADGLLTREEYRDANRKTRERWALTTSGLALIGVAPCAPSAPRA